MDGRFMGPGWHGGFRLFDGLFGIVLFALFIGLLVWALMRLMSNEHHLPQVPAGGPWQARDEALDAARIRYARGELDRDQYFRVVEDLTGVPRPAPAGTASAGTVPPYPAPPVPPSPPPAPPAPGEPGPHPTHSQPDA
jgi:uncharacterized membrane protein